MSLRVVGQRCLSEREPELGLGLVENVDEPAKRIAVSFPATGEKRLYALGTGVLKRVTFRAGETIAGRDGTPLVVEGIEEAAGLLTYFGGGRRLREDEISDVTSVSLPDERLLAGQADPNEVFNLRYRVLQAQARFRQSEVRGFLGGRVELIPHQFYILREVSSRQLPRVLLADEVGLGKTIEACLILQRLLAVGKVSRVLILVPESLTHQWFVELLRRFNLWFSIYDEERCAAVVSSDPGGNPFLAAQFVLCSVSFLAADEIRREQAVAAGWDLVIVDEAHHLVWAPEGASPEYALVEQLAARSPGLLLLTATPTQLGLAGHFARLRLLDPHRYADWDQFIKEADGYARVAGIAEKIVEREKLTTADANTLKRIFARDPERLAQHLDALSADRAGAAEALLRTLLDQHGTGRVMFRNTRAAMTGFPKRQLCAVSLPAGETALLARIAREIHAEETGQATGIRYSFHEDPRIDWLAGFLRQHPAAKVLLICRSVRKAGAIETALAERMKAKVALFHEGLPLIQRDRNAAWFAEPGGAQLLICSEIGSEGRNFQFAHHLVLFDLPFDPGLVEQRIGRLDRIGQTQTIRIHVPYIAGSAGEAVVQWYQRGVDAFETPLHGGEEYQQPFKERLLGLVATYGSGRGAPAAELESLIAETAAFRRDLNRRMKRGRDRLLELNSFDRAVAAGVIERIRESDADASVRRRLLEILDHFGVRVVEHEEGDVFLDPSHAFVEGFPSIPADGMLATFKRPRALAREDIVFLSADHPLVRDATELLLESPAGTTAFGTVPADAPNLLLEAIFVLETIAESRWHVDQFLAPTPVRVVVDVRGGDLTRERDAVRLAAEIDEADLHRFLERPGFDAAILRRMLAAATGCAEERARELKTSGEAAAAAALSAEIQRLVDLRRVNDHIRPEEIALAQTQLEQTRSAIVHARLRLDALRLILEAPAAGRR